MKLALGRLAAAVPMLLVVSFLMFGLVALVPGDPAVRLAGDNPTKEQIEQIRVALKLDLPFLQRHGDWLVRAALGDFGRSFSTAETVAGPIRERASVTASLTAVALLMTIMVGVSLGIAMALWSGSIFNRMLTSASALAAAMPSWFGIILVISFAIERPWFPALGYASGTLMSVARALRAISCHAGHLVP